MKFIYQIKKNQNHAAIQFSGNLIEPNQPNDFLKDVDELIANGLNNVIIDLSQINQMNSTGLNLLINLLTKTRNVGGETIIANVPDKVKKLIVITKLNTVFSVAKDMEEAANRINKEEQWL